MNMPNIAAMTTTVTSTRPATERKAKMAAVININHMYTYKKSAVPNKTPVLPNSNK